MGASIAVLDPSVPAERRPPRRTARITTALIAAIGVAAAVVADWRFTDGGGQAWLDLGVGLLLGVLAVTAWPISGRCAWWA